MQQNEHINSSMYKNGVVVKTARGEVRVMEYRGMDDLGRPIYAVDGPRGERLIAQVIPTLTVTGYDPNR